MSFKQKTLVSLLLLACFCIFSIVLLFYSLPFLIESSVIPGIADKSGLEKVSADIRRVGITGVDISDVKIGDQTGVFASIDSLRLNYSFKGLLQNYIDSIVISGIAIECLFKDGKVEIKGINLEKIAAISKNNDENRPSTPIPAINRVSIYNSEVILNYENTQLKFPVEIEGNLTDKKPRYDVKINLEVFDQKILFNFPLDFSQQKTAITFAAPSLKLENLLHLIPNISEFSMTGLAQAAGKIYVEFSPFKLATFRVVSELHRFGFSYSKNSLAFSRDPRPETIPTRLEISGNMKDWQFSLKNIAITAPVKINISELNSYISLSPEKLSGSGTFQLAIGPFHNKQNTISMNSSVSAKGNFSSKYVYGNGWSFSLAAEQASIEGTTQNLVRSNKKQFMFGSPVVSITGEGTKQTDKINYTIKIPEVKTVLENNVFNAPSFLLKGLAVVSPDRSVRNNFKVNIHKTTVKTDMGELSGNISLQGQMQAGSKSDHENKKITVSGELSLQEFSGKSESLKIKADNIKGIFPFNWPPPDSGNKGNFSIDSITFNNKLLGGMETSLWQKGTDYIFDGKIDGKIVTTAALNIKGKMHMVPKKNSLGNILFNLPPKSPYTINFGDFIDQGKGIRATGELDLQGEILLHKDGPESYLTTKITNSNFTFKDRGYVIEGIHTSVTFPNVFAYRSDPEQTITFDRGTAGDLFVTDGSVKFQIESLKSILVEDSSFKWAGGKIYSHALRIKPGIDEYNIVLSCERLKLSSILEQFGAATVTGEGSVNGRIPVVLRKGKIDFGDGFLYSTPGEGGTINMIDGNTLTAGIPKNTPQFAQIDFAMEALKNFKYQWVKLYLESEQDDLILKMELDGKPENPLPFRYDRRNGSFVRLEESGGRGIMRPIRLDVNFRLPLNQILYYSDGVNKLFEKMK